MAASGNNRKHAMAADVKHKTRKQLEEELLQLKHEMAQYGCMSLKEFKNAAELNAFLKETVKTRKPPTQEASRLRK